MDRENIYYRQVQLLLQLIPVIAQHECFALKGGTAINLFTTLVALVNPSLTDSERQFLLSFKNRSPDWSLLGLQGVDQLPAVRWKLQNLGKMSADKHAVALDRLRKILA